MTYFHSMKNTLFNLTLVIALSSSPLQNFQTKNTIFTTNQWEKCPHAAPGFKPMTSQLESSAITNRPGLPPVSERSYILIQSPIITSLISEYIDFRVNLLLRLISPHKNQFGTVLKSLLQDSGIHYRYDH